MIYIYSCLVVYKQPQDMPGECACVHSNLSHCLPLTHAFLSNTRTTPATFPGKVSCTRISPLAIVCFTLITRLKSPTLGGRESSRQVSCTHDHWSIGSFHARRWHTCACGCFCVFWERSTHTPTRACIAAHTYSKNHTRPLAISELRCEPSFDARLFFVMFQQDESL